MPRDARSFLWDAQHAAELIDGFVAGKVWTDYEQDVLLRSAVERQFEIIGEALGQLSQADADLAEKIPDLPRIVAFRNVLIHGYASVDDRLVWQVATERVEPLIALLTDLLGD